MSKVEYDADLLNVIEQGMKAEKAGVSKAELVSNEFLDGKPSFRSESNRKPFSEVFGWEPKTIPDIPVPYYERGYWNEQVVELIPQVNELYYLNKELVEEIMYGFYCEGTMLAYGPTGTGKTSIYEQIAARCGMPFGRVSCHGQMEVSEFIGANSVVNDGGTPITKHADTDTTLLAKHGGILCIDEVFRTPSHALMSLQALFEYPHRLNLQDAQGCARQLEVPLEDFKLVLTDNTNGTGDHTGMYTAEVQDISTLNRIRRSVYVDYMKPSEEKKLILNVLPELPPKMVADMIKVAGLVRTSFVDGAVQQTISIRELLSWGQSIMDLRNVEQSFKYAVLNRLQDTDREVVADIYRQVTGVTVK